MMAPRLTATFAIWRQPVAERRAQGNLGLTWCLLALFVLGALTLAVPSSQPAKVFVFFAAVPMSMLLFMWWIYLCANVARQCHPAALQLVPDLAVRVKRAVILAWLAIVAVMTLLAGFPSGHPGLVALVTALVLIEAGVMGSYIRYAIIGAACWALAHAGPVLTQSMHWFVATPAAVLAGALLVLLDGALALRRLGQRRMTVPARSNAIATFQQRMQVNGPGGRRASRFAPGADRQPAFLQPLGRSWFSLHLPTIALVAVACAWLHFWAAWNRQADLHAYLAGYRTVLAIALFGALAAAVYQESRRFNRARTEQALLCLTPAAPERADMNRLLARAWLAGFARSWLIFWALTMLALGSLGAQAPELARLSAVWLVALLPGVVAMRQGASALAGCLLLTCLIGAGAVATNGEGAPILWLALGGAAILSGVGLARWRWQQVLAAAPALPRWH